MLSYKESLKILKETNALLEGHFILSSGLHSKEYIQCAKLLRYPKQAEIICSSLKEKINGSFKNISLNLLFNQAKIATWDRVNIIISSPNFNLSGSLHFS